MFNFLSKLASLVNGFTSNWSTEVASGRTSGTAKLSQDVIQLNDSVQLSLSGVPSDISQEQYQQILQNLIQHSLSTLSQRNYQQGERIYDGKLKIKLNEVVHDVYFALDATRVVNAIAIYKQGFDIVKEKAMSGVYDQGLAQDAAMYFKQSAWNELRRVQPKNARENLPASDELKSSESNGLIGDVHAVHEDGSQDVEREKPILFTAVSD